MFYQFTYKTYPKGTILPTYSENLSPEDNAALDAVDQFLTNGLGTDPAGVRKGEQIDAKAFSVPAGGHVTVSN